MSGLDEQRERNQKLRSLAMAWVAGSFAIGILLGAVLFFSARVDSREVMPTAEPAEPVPTAAAQQLPPPVLPTGTPAGGSASGQTSNVGSRSYVPLDAFGYGIQVHGPIGDPSQTTAMVEQLGFGWIKQQVRWGDMELAPGEVNWGLLDGIMDAAQASKLRVLLSVVTAPAWTRPAYGNTHGPPDDLNQFTAFLNKLIDRYPGQISAIEVWNEQNLEREWQTPSGIIAVRYLEMLRMAYEGIKAKDPTIVVVSGALAPTGGWVEPDGRISAVDDFTYFQQMLEAGLVNFADCVGAHHNGYNIGPDVTAEEAPNDPQAATSSFRGPFENVHHSWSLKTTLQGYAQMLAGQRLLCVTEFGWASTEGVGGTPAGFGFADDNTLQEQAEWIVEAYQAQREWGITWLAFLWNLDFGPKGLGPEDDNVPYSILNLDGSPRPAFDALEAMQKP